MSRVIQFLRKHHKKITGGVVSTTLLVVAVAFTHIAFFKPLIEFIDFKTYQAADTVRAYDGARKGDPESLKRMVQLTHEDSGIAYIFLSAIYRNDAIKASGIDLKDPEAKLETVDFTQADQLVFQALREASDMELNFILMATSEAWSEDGLSKMTNGAESMTVSTGIKNRIKLDGHSSFTAEQKTELQACSKKLTEKFSNPYWSILNIRSLGTCSKHPGDGSFAKLLSLSSIFDVSVDVDDIEDAKPSTNEAHH